MKSKQRPLRLASIFVLLILAGCARHQQPQQSGLVWDKESQTAQLAPAETGCTLEFPFVNRYPVPIRLLSVAAGCSACSRAAWDTGVVPSGGHSAVKLIVDAGKKANDIETWMVVRDDHGGQYRLRAVVKVPQVVRLFPGFVWWRPGEKDRRTVKIWINPQYPATLSGVAPSQIAGLNPVLRKTDEQGDWELQLSPPSVTAPRWQGEINLLTSRAEPRWKAVPLYLYVKEG